MKKVLFRILLFSIICSMVFFIARCSNKYIKTSTNALNNNFVNDIETTISSEPKKIISRGELKTSGLYMLEDGTMDPSIDLMSTDMTYTSSCNLYKKIITNMLDYNKYKNRIKIPDMNESDFEKSFLVIVANENLRHFDYEKDLIIYDVYSDDSVTHIIMKQRENPNLEINQAYLNNVFYAIVDNSQLKEKSDIVIEQ